MTTKISPFKTISNQNGAARIDVGGARYPTYDQWRQSWNGYRFPPPYSGSVLYFPGFPYTGSTIKDFSGSSNDGSITGATWVRLPSGLWYLSFDGNDLVAMPDNASLQLTGDFTVEAWAKRGATNGGVTHFVIASKYDTGGDERGWALSFDANDQIEFAISKDGTSGASLTSLTTTETYTDLTVWLHILATYDSIADGSSVMKIRVNDVEKATTSSAVSPLYNSADPARIGCMQINNVNSRFMIGGIALFRIYTGVLTGHYQQERYLFGV